MDLNPSTLLVGLLVSSIGLALLMYGRRMGRPPHIVVGLLLLVYPYFVPSALAMLAIGAGLLVLLWFVLRLGW